MSKVSELTSMCESLGFGVDSVDLNYKSSIVPILKKILPLDPDRYKEITDYNILYNYPKNTVISRSEVNKLVNILNDKYLELINTKTSIGNNVLVTLTLVEDENRLKYKILINTITGVCSFTLL